MDFSFFSITIFSQGLQRFISTVLIEQQQLLSTSTCFHKFQKHTNFGLNQLFFSSSVQFSIIFDFNLKFWNGASSCPLNWGIFYILWGMHRTILCSMKNILYFYLHRIAARRVRAVTSRLVIFSVDDNWWWWWWQLMTIDDNWWGRNFYMRSSPFQTIIQSCYLEAKRQSDKNRDVLSKTFYITTKNEAMKYTFLLLPQKPPLTLFKNDSCKIMIFILKCEH